MIHAAAKSPPAVHVEPEAARSSTACGEWRFALVGTAFEPVQNVPLDELVTKWRAGAIGATAQTEAALSKRLGTRTSQRAVDHEHWAIVPVHELSPQRSLIFVDGRDPLVSDDSPLVARVCGATPTTNFDREHLTTLVMSGTTALTGRTAKRIDDRGVRDFVRYIRDFFTTADVVHVSNEVSFVRSCDL